MYSGIAIGGPLAGQKIECDSQRYCKYLEEPVAVQIGSWDEVPELVEMKVIVYRYVTGYRSAEKYRWKQDFWVLEGPEMLDSTGIFEILLRTYCKVQEVARQV